VHRSERGALTVLAGSVAGRRPQKARIVQCGTWRRRRASSPSQRCSVSVSLRWPIFRSSGSDRAWRAGSSASRSPRGTRREVARQRQAMAAVNGAVDRLARATLAARDRAGRRGAWRASSRSQRRAPSPRAGCRDSARGRSARSSSTDRLGRGADAATGESVGVLARPGRGPYGRDTRGQRAVGVARSRLGDVTVRFRASPYGQAARCTAASTSIATTVPRCRERRGEVDLRRTRSRLRRARDRGAPRRHQDDVRPSLAMYVRDGQSGKPWTGGRRRRRVGPGDRAAPPLRGAGRRCPSGRYLSIDSR
jgi:hypothetical protein